MPRKPRDSFAGIHHIWVNATDDWAYFDDPFDRLTWIRRFLQILDRESWTCLAFCQMTTHVHVLVEVPDASLPAGMLYLNREYSKDFNARHGRVGAFLRSRYGSRRTVDTADLLATYAYVVLNAVREGMCERAENWPWSSFATTLGISDDFPFVDASKVLDEFATSPNPVAALREFVAGQFALDQFRHVRYLVPDMVASVR